MRLSPTYALGLAAVVAACGPVSVEQAEQNCFQQARLAQHPRGMIAMGVGTHGSELGGSVEISSDYLMGRDPTKVYEECVYQQSGQPPRRPLFDRPDWKG